MMLYFGSFASLLLLLLLSLSVSAATDEWRFVVFADWHGAESFVNNPIKDEKSLRNDFDANRKSETFQHIKENYGGELVLLPGDSNSGKWYKDEFLDLLNVDTAKEAVRKAAKRCYQSMKLVFELAGYSKILFAVGDHELGGNSWPLAEPKTGLLRDFRNIFYGEFNKDENGGFLYKEPIGKADSRPLNTVFEKTSYAYRHKNVLFVTVDVFQSMPSDFMDRSRGLGGEGSVTCDVTGPHLDWFRKVLSEARKDETIKHIFVQAHPPIIQPVRKIRCTGQFMDGADTSDFFKAMRQHNVDVYFSGDVHANTVTKDDRSNLVQVVSRGNACQNFLTVEVSDDVIRINQFNEIGPRARYNRNYEFYGQVIIDKSRKETVFESTGSLKLLDREKPMIHLSFDETFPLLERPVLAMEHDDIKDSLIQRKITIQGVECWDSFPNMGEFGQQYDAQVANVALEKGVQGKAAAFNSTDSRVAIFALGPHSGGVKVSYALWFKTKASKANQVLISFGDIFGMTEYNKNKIFTLTLDKGVPALYAAADMKLVPTDKSIAMADATWQHLAISMPRNSCRLSEVQMFVNGERVDTKVQGKDDYLFFTTSGSISIGGFGHSDGKIRRDIFPSHKPYMGLIDELYVWAERLSMEQVGRLIAGPTLPPKMAPTASPTQTPTRAPTRAPFIDPSYNSENSDGKVEERPTETPPLGRSDADFTAYDGHYCDGASFVRLSLKPHHCRSRCRHSSRCAGYDVKLNRNDVPVCRIFFTKPTLGSLSKRFVDCGIKH